MSDGEMSDGEKLATLREMLNREVRKREAAEMREVVLLAQRERLLAVVVRLAGTPGKLCCRFDCNINERWSDVFPERWSQHADDCLVTQARAALAAVDGGEHHD